jgi:FkbM family methyltransferase
VIEKAVGCSEGEFPFYMNVNGAGGSNTLSQDWNKTSLRLYKKLGLNVIFETVMVPVVRLDSMLHNIPTVNFIKIDVEGAEVDVLNGGRELIQQHHPILMVACHDTAPCALGCPQWSWLLGVHPEKKRIHYASNITGVSENYFCLHPHWHAAPLQAHFGIVES